MDIQQPTGDNSRPNRVRGSLDCRDNHHSLHVAQLCGFLGMDHVHRGRNLSKAVMRERISVRSILALLALGVAICPPIVGAKTLGGTTPLQYTALQISCRAIDTRDKGDWTEVPPERMAHREAISRLSRNPTEDRFVGGTSVCHLIPSPYPLSPYPPLRRRSPRRQGSLPAWAANGPKPIAITVQRYR